MKKGRPKLETPSNRVSLRIPNNNYLKLKELAKEEKIPIATYINQLISNHVNK